MTGAPVRRILQTSSMIACWFLFEGASAWGMARGHVAAIFPFVVFTGTAVWALDAFFPAIGRGAVRRGPRVLYGEPPRVALTFDDGPSEDTAAVLTALDQAGVRATFFMLGRHAIGRPGIVRAVACAGHAIAHHTWSHQVLAWRGPRRIREEIARTRRAFDAAGVTADGLFRAPRGFQGPIVRHVLQREGLKLIAWTRGAWDSEPRTPEEIAAQATVNPRDGDILLLHDGAGTRGFRSRAATAAAVPLIAEVYRRRGFRFVTVPELLGETRSRG